MISGLLMVTLGVATQVAAPTPVDVDVQAKFLNRSELPADIDFALLELGYAVVRVRVENRGGAEWTLNPDTVEVRDPKGKVLKPAPLEEITPKVLKHGKSSRRAAGYGAEVGTRNEYPGIYPGRYPTVRGATYPGVYQPPIPGNAPPRTVAVGEAQRVRGVLQDHLIAETPLQPGESLEGLIYLKCKKPASELRGGALRISSLPPVEVQ